ncbi:MAG: hypothetical protein WKI04_06225 [Ferruginibacter sp.]
MKYITTATVISQQKAYKNGICLFADEDGALPAFLIAAYRHFGFNYPRFYKMDNLAKLGWLASEILLQGSLESGRYQPEEVGIVFSNASSSLDADLKYFESARDIASPSLFVYTLPNIVIGEICIKHKFKGESAFFIFESFNADFLEKYVSGLFNSNILQACICGWVECIENEYKAALFLVETDMNELKDRQASAWDSVPLFTKDNLNKIYHLSNG